MDSIILTGLVGLVCQDNIDINTNQACTSVIEASARSSGIYDQLRQLEKKQEKKLVQMAKEQINKDARNLVATTFALATIASGRRAALKIWKSKEKGEYYVEVERSRLTINYGIDF